MEKKASWPKQTDYSVDTVDFTSKIKLSGLQVKFSKNYTLLIHNKLIQKHA